MKPGDSLKEVSTLRLTVIKRSTNKQRRFLIVTNNQTSSYFQKRSLSFRFRSHYCTNFNGDIAFIRELELIFPWYCCWFAWSTVFFPNKKCSDIFPKFRWLKRILSSPLNAWTNSFSTVSLFFAYGRNMAVLCRRFFITSEVECVLMSDTIIGTKSSITPTGSFCKRKIDSSDWRLTRISSQSFSLKKPTFWALAILGKCEQRKAG